MPTSAINALYPRSLKYLTRHLQALVRGRLWLQVIVGMVLGIMTGILIGPSVGLLDATTAATLSDWLAFPGKLFLALIQMMVIPLVFASIIRGLAATEDLEQLRRIGLRVVVFFVVTTALAIVIGLVVASVIKPGLYVDSQALQATLGPISALPEQAASTGLSFNAIPQKIVTLLPSNPLSSMVESNMLQVVIFAMVVGVALVMMAPAQAKPLLDLMGSLQEVCMTVVRWAMRLAPIAVFGLIAQLTAKLGLNALMGMAVYILTVLLGLLLMFVCLSGHYFCGCQARAENLYSGCQGCTVTGIFDLQFGGSDAALNQNRRREAQGTTFRGTVCDSAGRYHQHEWYCLVSWCSDSVPRTGVWY